MKVGLILECRSIIDGKAHPKNSFVEVEERFASALLASGSARRASDPLPDRRGLKPAHTAARNPTGR